MAVMDCSAASQTISQQIQIIAQQSVSACTIQHHLQQSRMFARLHCCVYPWFKITGAINGTMNDGHKQLNGMTLFLLTNSAFTCNTIMTRLKSGGTMVRVLNYCFMHHITDCAPSIMVWDGIAFHSCNLVCIARYTEQLLLYLWGVGACCPPIPSEHAISHIPIR